MDFTFKKNLLICKHEQPEVKMGILDNLTGSSGSETRTGSSDIISTVLNMISGNQHGGLGGIINSFNEKGLGGLISSWIGKGENQQPSDDDIRRGFGEERINEISKQTGKPPDTVVSILKNQLPQVVDKLTPDGNVPDDNLLQKGINMLKNLKL